MAVTRFEIDASQASVFDSLFWMLSDYDLLADRGKIASRSLAGPAELFDILSVKNLTRKRSIKGRQYRT